MKLPDSLKNKKTIALILSALLAAFGAPLPNLQPLVPLGVQLVCLATECSE